MFLRLDIKCCLDNCCALDDDFLGLSINRVCQRLHLNHCFCLDVYMFLRLNIYFCLDVSCASAVKHLLLLGCCA